MFSNVAKETLSEVREIINNKLIISFESIISKINNNELLGLEEGIALFKYCYDDSNKKEVFNKNIVDSRSGKYSNQLNLIVPHYHSSRCADNCSYCGFRRENKDIERIHLDENNFVQEFELLLDWGYRAFEFVYATDPHYTPKIIAERIDVAKKIAKQRGVTVQIGVDSQAFDEAGYRVLTEKGMDFLVLWMETYLEIYHDVHPRTTKKANYNFRVNVPERALRGGCSRYSLGVLLGLGDWMEDASMLLAHGIYLREKYGHSPYIIGIPKLTNAMGAQSINKNLISDETLMLISWVYKAIFPETKLFVNSRQTLDVNCNIVDGGGDLFTIDFATFPGDYLKGLSNSPEHQQFETLPYGRQETIDILIERGFSPKFEW